MTSEPLRVGYVLKRYPRFSETFVVNEILAHERAGLSLIIFALGPVMETHFQPDIGAVKAPVIRLTDKQRNIELFWGLVKEGLAALPDFAVRLAEERDHDVHELAQGISLALAVRQHALRHLHAHFATQAATVARLAAKFSDISWSFTAHAKDIYYRYDTDIQLARKIQDASHVITVSDYNLAWLCERYGGDRQKVSRLYNGLDLRQFPWLSPLKRQAHILAVGRLVPKKGFRVLIAALAQLQAKAIPFHCTLIGDGPERSALEAAVVSCELQAKVSFTGLLSRQRVAKAIQQSAMVVAPCIISEDGDRDGLPTIMVEAMALGTPVISTRVAGIPELVIDGQTGLCVGPEDVVGLADAMVMLLSGQDMREKLARQARRMIVRDYDIDRNIMEMQKIFTPEQK
ncbi:glycosyltransferase family 4 protein [Erwinia sp. 198]|uniref:glycosyltransferase family 4 protein n=1 Tax=Erwinia sp. 198 TaxID=2022746 RepID=UPI000F679095|nr:glycosyltransferase family 4 protein [Erwinia sp. 198]RRZ88463.1 colanic acid biosynthesis glycosyltransferase WcaL [Erwinia sp. 198]